jgi:claudin
MIASVCLGFFGATLALMGMKCTRIGGSESTKARLTGLSGLHFILNGEYSLYCVLVELLLAI